MTKFYVACVSVIEKEDKVLMVREGKDGAEDLWALPGGSLEENEKLEKCVEREVKEETGLETEAEKLIGTYMMQGDTLEEKMFVFAFKSKPKTENIETRENDTVKEATFLDSENLEENRLRFTQLKQIIQDSKNPEANRDIKYL